MRILLFILCMFFAVDAKAACTPMPTCEELNYTDTKCDGEFITCPFDETKIKCLSSNVDCAQMGFTQDNKSTWCGKEISCPTDPKYTACVEAYENPCPNGYDNRILSVEDCGEQRANGWTFTSTTITGNNGQNILCGKCSPRSCLGYDARYQSAEDCGAGGAGWFYASCYEGDDKVGKCTAKTCSSYGYHDSSDRNNGRWLCDETHTRSVYLGNTLTTCYDCVSCGQATKFTDRSYTYANQSGIDKCRNKTDGLWGCYSKYVSGTYTSGMYKYTGQCDACIPIGVSIAYPGLEAFCCKNNETKQTGANWSCN